MNEILLNKLNELKDEISNSNEVKKLRELDALLNKNEEVMKLAYAKDMASVAYEDALKHFGDNSQETLDAQKKLHEAKLQLDTHELVKQYNEQFKIVRKMYDKINEELFNPFN